MYRLYSPKQGYMLGNFRDKNIATEFCENVNYGIIKKNKKLGESAGELLKDSLYSVVEDNKN